MKMILVISSVILVPLMMYIMNAGGQTQGGLDMQNSTNSTVQIVSSVGNVTVNGFEITSPRSMDIDLIYSGSEGAPAIEIDSSAISINYDIVNQIGMINLNSTDFITSNSSNSTTSLEEISMSNGTKSLDSG
jgi:hypothetical protein